jgi:hypothetical protein
MSHLKASIILPLLFIAGCASGPTPEQIARADYGEYPNDYENIVHAFFDRTLKDPGSLQLREVAVPTQAYLSLFGHAAYGYKTCVTYNAKNGFGAYTGYTTEYLLIHNGVVIQNVDKADRVAEAMHVALC